MKLIKESVNPRHERIKKEYCKWSDDHKIPTDKESVNEWAKRRTCVNQNVSEEQFNEAMFESYLSEDTLEQAAEKELNAEVAYKGTLEQTLDKALKHNLREHKWNGRDFLNVLFVGEAGSGKTARIEQWAADHNVNLVEVRGNDLDPADFSGVVVPDDDRTYSKKLGSTEFHNLEIPNSVLFLDEYNRAPKAVRSSLMQLVNSHVVYDPNSPKSQRYLPNFLFTVAAINPSNVNYDTDYMDMAEKSRFLRVDLESDPKATLAYLTKKLKYIIDNTDDEEEKAEAQGKLDLATALLTSNEFEFDNPETIDRVSENDEKLLSARTLVMALNASEGKKDLLLKYWADAVNNESKPMIQRILANYKDADDKANAALDNDTESELFGKKASSMDKIRNTLKGLGINN